MEVVRAATLDDWEPLFDLIERSGFGLTSLRLTKAQLHERLEWSHFAFTRKSERPGGEPYVFVMEDLATGALVGTSCIFAKTGGYEPFYAYEVVTEAKASEELDVRASVRTLQLKRIHDGPTEIGSLFLLPEFRGQGRGSLLSIARFSMIAQRPGRFASEVIAEMRGVSDAQGHSPFWEAVGRHFFHVDFPVADALSTVSKKFIEDLMPQHPIYWDLLPAPVCAVIGQVHDQTRPAQTMLQREGFASRGLVDIFDAGPILHSPRDAIRSVASCRNPSVRTGDVPADAKRQIVTTSAARFRAVHSQVHWIDDGHVILPETTRRALLLNAADKVWTLG
ncbi:Arginine N-succinyltransferase subunit beta [Rosistilla carotiformis]|uniref:Arginine N-succinyltransferase subunit beta n=1 Tax=Rosistilla carotiformis TaxID=2528017 RepID=A0A518JW25_9BACT|nr:arginine N-succinyltransferase [Rosistilla carotiformis]QDV69740.1 Arginine N-succinyltransferase subunit beta [Rosistilla carotiformis]